MSGLKVCFCQDVQPIESKVQISGDRASSYLQRKSVRDSALGNDGTIGCVKNY